MSITLTIIMIAQKKNMSSVIDYALSLVSYPPKFNSFVIVKSAPTYLPTVQMFGTVCYNKSETIIQGEGNIKSEFIDSETFALLMRLLLPPNRLVMEICLHTGLRIGDVVALTRDQVAKGRFSLREQKTGKSRRVYIPVNLRVRVLAQAGTIYAFEGRDSPSKHRTRQAVYLDLKRAAKALRLPQNVSPHTARKAYAVALYARTGDLSAVQRALNHDRDTVTLLYALSDKMLSKPKPKRKKKQ